MKTADRNSIINIVSSNIVSSIIRSINCISKIIFFSTLILFCEIDNIYAQGWQWAKGSMGGDIESAPIATDAAGNVFIAGFAESGPFSFGSFTIPFTAFYLQTFITKYDNAGNVLWAKGIDFGSSTPLSLTTDHDGNVIMLGIFWYPGIQVEGVNLLLSTGYTYQYFISKFDPSGNVLWAHTSAEASAYIVSFNQPTGIQPTALLPGSIATDASGNIFITGCFNGTATSIGAFNLLNTDASGATDDIFVAKYDPLGNVVWAKNYGGSKSDDVYGITVTHANNIYISGAFSSPIINFGSIAINNSFNIQKAFVAELDPTGTPIWAQAAGGSKSAYGIALISDESNNVYLTGSFGDTAITFGTTVINRTYPAAVPMLAQYLVKFSSSNIVIWSNTIGSSSAQAIGYGIALSPCGEVWVSGAWGFLDNILYQMGNMNVKGHIIPTLDSSADPMYMACFNTDGDYIDALAIRSGGDDWSGITCDASGSLLLCADYTSGWGPDFLIGNINLPPTPYEFALVAKYSHNAPVTDTVFRHTDTSFCAAGSLLLQPPIGYLGPYIWSNGTTGSSLLVNEAGTYWVLSAGGCNTPTLIDTFHVVSITKDSIFKYSDTTICSNTNVILQAPLGYLVYQWNQGSLSQNITITNPGIFWVTCDGACTVPYLVDTFHVAIDTIAKPFSLGNDTFACNPITLTIPQTGLYYQWQNGSTNQYYTASTSGSYYATITDHVCKFSDTINVEISTLKEHNTDTLLCIDKQFELILNPDVPVGSSIHWNTGGITPTITIYDTGTYFATIYEGGCTVSDTMHVKGQYCECGCMIPNAFTPNGDQLNDGFKPLFQPTCHVYNYQFSVFNRWGQIVFTTTNLSARWDGTFGGGKAEMGTYMYEVYYQGGVPEKIFTFKGEVILIR